MSGTALDADTLAELTRIASWDGPLVALARGTFADVLDRQTAWRARLDAAGRALGTAECWSGPAADVAAATAAELSRIAAAVHASFARSQDGWNALSTSTSAAQSLAERAVAIAGEAGVGPVGRTPDVPGRALFDAVAPDVMALREPASASLDPEVLACRALAAEALAEAAVAGAAARTAGREVGDLAAAVPGAPVGVPELLARLGPLQVPEIPPGRSPAEVAAWWATLSAGERSIAVERRASAVGSLDGVPAWARDRANRCLLQELVADPTQPPDVERAARLLTARIEDEEAAGRTVQLHLLDLDQDRVALAFGDLDTADAVALLVPGIFTTPTDDLEELIRDAGAVAAASATPAHALTVTTVVWMGYRTPQSPWAAVGRSSSRTGGRALDDALDGLASARTALGGSRARTTLLAHSYGTVVVDEAADRPGRLAADAVVLLGSPGMSEDAANLEAPEVYDAWSVGDPISWSGWFGLPPGIEGFGSVGLPTSTWAGHSDYYDTDQPTLAAIGEVVSGVRTGD